MTGSHGSNNHSSDQITKYTHYCVHFDDQSTSTTSWVWASLKFCRWKFEDRRSFLLSCL